MITTSDESWATTTLRDAQDPGAGHQEWPAKSRITLERYNLNFSQQAWRGYSASGQSAHDCGTVLESSLATLYKVALVGNDLLLTKWSVGSGLEIDDTTIVTDPNISDTARPSLWLGTGATGVTAFYIDEDDDYIHYIESADGGASFGAEQNVGAQTNLKAISAVSATKVHCVSYVNGNSRFHFYELDGSWAETDSLIYWPHEIQNISAITIGNRDLIVFYSEGPMFGAYREAGIYGIWEKHGRWSDIFKIDVLDEADNYSYRKEPMLSENSGIYFLTGYLSEGDEDYSHATRFLKTSKDGEHWSQYQPLVTTPEAGPAKLLVINAATGQSWPFDTGQQCYIVGHAYVYESDATRLVGEVNTALQVDVTSRTKSWQLSRGVISQANTVLSNHDGVLDSHAIINENNTLLCKREAGYWTGAADEYAQLTLEIVDYIRETDQLPKRHKQCVSRDFMAWMRDREADHHEEWESQLVGYDTFHDDSETGYGGLGHTATQTGWWKTESDMLWLVSDNKEGIAFCTWDSHIMNGQHKVMARIETSGNNEYAGIIFRGKDKGNLWAVYYDQASDKILLRQKVGGGWQAAAAQSGTLSWSIDTFYGIMVDFRYSYIRVFYSTDGLTWTQAFTHVISQNPSLPANEYGYVGYIAYGFSDQDQDHIPEYEPPTPPPPVVPPAPGAEGDGNKGYFCDATSGRFFRVESARAADPTSVVYTDLGVIDAGGIAHFALDSWDPKNRAIACGDNGIWRTENLDDALPTWAKIRDSVVAGNKWHRFKMVASSICQQGRWAIVSRYWNGDQSDWFCFLFTTDDNGDTFTSKGFDHWANNCGVRPTIELSSHDANVGWITWQRSGDEYVSVTDDFFVTHSSNAIPNFHNSTRPCSYHRYFDNSDDQKALWGGKSAAGAAPANANWCTGDYGSCTSNTIHTSAAGEVHWVGGYTWGAQRYWALIKLVSGDYEFCVSDDGLSWTVQYTFPGTTQWISGFPTDKERFYATQNGAVAPLLLSEDGGLTWQEQTGNWASELGYTGDIPCFIPVWIE